jgi:hypothetical protein
MQKCTISDARLVQHNQQNINDVPLAGQIYLPIFYCMDMYGLPLEHVGQKSPCASSSVHVALCLSEIVMRKA